MMAIDGTFPSRVFVLLRFDGILAQNLDAKKTQCLPHQSEPWRTYANTIALGSTPAPCTICYNLITNG